MLVSLVQGDKDVQRFWGNGDASGGCSYHTIQKLLFYTYYVPSPVKRGDMRCLHDWLRNMKGWGNESEFWGVVRRNLPNNTIMTFSYSLTVTDKERMWHNSLAVFEHLYSTESA